MTAALQRRVLRARLRCSRPEQAAHSRVLLEDALRTASLPDQGRLVVFRRVDLGRLSPRGSATAWSRRLEFCLARLAADAVAFDEPAAARANAIWFPAGWQAPVELAVRLMAGQAVDAWFWRAVVPGHVPGLLCAATARLIFRQLTQSGGHAATLALARRLLRSGQLVEFAGLLSTDDFELWRPGDSQQTAEREAPAAAQVERLWSTIPARWRARLAADARAGLGRSGRFHWILAGVLSECDASLGEPQAVREMASRVVEHVESAPHAVPGAMESPFATGFASSKTRESERSSLPPMSGGTRAESRVAEPTNVFGAAPATQAAGLLFTLNVLRRAGWPEWLGAEDRVSAAVLGVAWLRGLADRLDLPEPDGVRAWLASFELPEPSRTVTFRVPDTESWQVRGSNRSFRIARRIGYLGGRVLLDPSARLPVAAWAEATRRWAGLEPVPRVIRHHAGWPAQIDPLQTALTLIAQRLCWRRARLGWRSLVLRPGLISWNDTHVDVFLALRSADVRVRRAGFDLDPGWLPWLGRVVTFHYVEEAVA